MRGRRKGQKVGTEYVSQHGPCKNPKCGKMFPASKSNALTCSPNCRNVLYRARIAADRERAAAFRRERTRKRHLKGKKCKR